jgi:hypothetical protein
MARIFKVPKHQTGRTITTKTPYGSTGDMVVTDESILSKVSVDNDSVLLKDDEGFYITYKNRVDSGLSDPFRYSTDYRVSVAEKISAQLGDINESTNVE